MDKIPWIVWQRFFLTIVFFGLIIWGFISLFINFKSSFLFLILASINFIILVRIPKVSLKKKEPKN